MSFTSLRDKITSLNRAILALLSILTITIGFFPSSSQAVQCTVDIPPPGITGADPYITGAASTTSCGIGTGENDNSGDTFFNGIFGGTWTQLDKDGGSPDSDGALFFEVTQFNGGEQAGGNWFVTDPGGYDRFTLVLKDGDIPDASYQWVWFELGSTCNDGIASASLNKPVGTDFCGQWQMYLGKGLSHMSLWAGDITDGGGDNGTVPEPSTLLLLGSGLVIFSGLARRFRKKQLRYARKCNVHR